MSRHIAALASLIIAILGIGRSASAQSLDVSEYLARCNTDQAFCQDEVARIERMANAIPGANCPPAGMSIDTMTSSVVEALKGDISATPQDAFASADNAIDQVLAHLWPCSQ